MARALTIDINQIIPEGYIVLIKPVEFKDKKYTKVWSEFWDVFLHKDKMNSSLEERRLGRNWVWHSIIDDKVVFHISAENILEYVQTFTEPQNKEIYIIKNRKKNAKIQKKANHNRSRTIKR